MGRDPAVLFYTSDFLTGTITMSYEHRGMYITLLCYQHQKGFLTEKDLKFVCENAQDICEKFELIDGKFYNKRMKDEAERRSAFSESRRKNRMSPDKGKEVGIQEVKDIARLCWDNEIWREQICMGLSLTEKELGKWMAQFNSSVSNDKILNFNEGSYKKMLRGWIVAQQRKGTNVVTIPKLKQI